MNQRGSRSCIASYSQTKLATPPGELDLEIGTVVNGTRDVDESGGEAAGKIEYI